MGPVRADPGEGGGEDFEWELLEPLHMYRGDVVRGIGLEGAFLTKGRSRVFDSDGSEDSVRPSLLLVQ